MRERLQTAYSSRIFNLVHHNSLVYNACWEDPRLDREALQLTGGDSLVMITSAGCNALDYALDGPAAIHAVDVNPRQNALLELKLASIRRLDYPTFFSMFGKGRLANPQQVYDERLRGALSLPARSFWDKHIGWFAPSRLWPSFYFRGSCGAVARMLGLFIDLRRMRPHLEAIFQADNTERQQAIYESILRDALWTGTVRWALRRDGVLSLLGVPRPQREQVERSYAGGIARFIEDCVEFVFTRLPLQDNYFWWLYLTGEYEAFRCPEYLREENFERLKGGLVDRVQVHTNSIEGFLRGHREPVTRFVLLDHMDWMSVNRLSALESEWQAIVDQAAPEARLLWRSAALEVDYIDPIQVRLNAQRTRLGELLAYRQDWAEALQTRDRVHTYGSFYIADLAKA